MIRYKDEKSKVVKIAIHECRFLLIR